MLPDFDERGNLPEAIYVCDKPMLYHRFVQQFPKSTQRKSIHEGFSRLYNLIQAQGLSATQWVNGSFTTRKLNPHNPNEELEPDDVDIVTFMDYDGLNALSPSAQVVVASLLNAREGTKPLYRSHTFLVASCQPGHPYFATFEYYRRYFRDFFSRHSPPSTRSQSTANPNAPFVGYRKGILELTIGDPLLAPKVDGRRL